MAYGTVKVDNITFTNGGIDQTVTVSGIVQSISGNITATGTIQAATIIGTSTVSGATVTGNAGQFTTATAATGVFTSQISGATVTGNVGSFTTITGGTVTLTSGVFGAGTASLPSISFSSDPNTGIYSPGADQVAVATSGAGRLFIDSSGRVGVGTASAATLLEVYAASGSNLVRVSNGANTGTDNAGVQFVQGGAQKASIYTSNNNLYVNGNGETVLIAGTSSPMSFYTNGSERLRITAAGLVGVGTSVPTGLLTVAASAPVIDWANSSNTAFKHTIEAVNFSSTAANNTFAFKVASGSGTQATVMTLNGAGNVGIGTTNVRQRLTLGSTTSTQTSTPECIDLGGTYSNTGGANLKVLLYNDGTNRHGLGVSSLASDYVAPSNAAHVFYRGSTESARIDSSGRLLVGTSTASSAGSYAQYGLIKIQGNSASSGGSAIINIARGEGASTITSGEDLGAISFTDSAGNEFATIVATADANAGANDYPGRLTFSTTADGASSPTERMRIRNDGNIGIGEAGTAGARLSVTSTGTAYAGYFTYPVAAQGIGIASSGAGSANAVFFFNNGTNVGSIFTTSSTTAYNTSSDYRLKENVSPVTDGITRLQQLKPSRFNFIADPAKTVDGFLAHEAQAVVPECVTGEKDAVDDDGNPIYQGIDQSKLVPLLTAALQEAVAKIEVLEQRLNDAGIN